MAIRILTVVLIWSLFVVGAFFLGYLMALSGMSESLRVPLTAMVGFVFGMCGIHVGIFTAFKDYLK